MSTQLASNAIAIIGLVLMARGFTLFIVRDDPAGIIWVAWADVVYIGASLMWHSRFLAILFAVLAVLTFWLWWRKRRDHIRAWFGNKARALRARLLTRLRERTAPAPI